MSENEHAIKAASFDINIDNGFATVKRKFTLDKINIEFDVAIPLTDVELTVLDLHHQSVREVIALLQTMLPAEK